MKPTITLLGPKDSKHTSVLVEPGSEAETKWRGKGYATEAELADAHAKAEVEAKKAAEKARAEAEAKKATKHTKTEADPATKAGAGGDEPPAVTKAELKEAVAKAEDIETLRFLADKGNLDLSGKVTKVDTAKAKLLEQLEA